MIPDPSRMFTRIVNDPRRLPVVIQGDDGHLYVQPRMMLLVGCWCGRVYTVTPEELSRHKHAGTLPCPAPCHRLEAAA